MSAILERLEIAQAVQDWGLWRDTGQWDRLRRLYTHDATVSTTWFVGSAAQFVERSIESARKGARAQHFIGASTVELNGDRAVAETRMVLLIRAGLEGTEIDVTCYGRLYDWFLRTGEGWRIHMRGAIYEKDRLDPVDPAARVSLDGAALARFPEGYRHVAYVQARGGASITPDLPTPGSASLARLYAAGAAWLAGSPNPEAATPGR